MFRSSNLESSPLTRDVRPSFLRLPRQHLSQSTTDIRGRIVEVIFFIDCADQQKTCKIIKLIKTCVEFRVTAACSYIPKEHISIPDFSKNNKPSLLKWIRCLRVYRFYKVFYMKKIVKIEISLNFEIIQKWRTADASTVVYMV